MKRIDKTLFVPVQFNRFPNGGGENYRYRVRRVNPKTKRRDVWGYYHTIEQAQSAAAYANAVNQ